MDYFFQEQRWTDTFLSLHVKQFKRIILFLLIAFSAAGAKAQSDVKFNDGVRYSQWVIDSRMNNFYANTTKCGFAVYNQEGTQTSPRDDGKTKLDYVVGLVAKSIIEASQYYSQFTWAQSFAKPWFLSIQDYGNEFYSKFSTSGGSLDDLNAVKLFIPLRALTATNGKYPNTTTFNKTTTALDNAITGLNAHNTNYRIKDENILAKTAGKDVLGGWWHKKAYENQMWLDGAYMGPALFAELVNYSGKTTNIDSSNDWDLIVKQFEILHSMCWNSTDKLPYHAFAADGGTNSTSHSDTWAGLSSKSPYVFHSASYWGRAVGWYFLALVDILEQMDNAKLTSTEGYTTLLSYLKETAEGIKDRQDQDTGGWYQILDKNSEFSASSYNDGQSHTTTNNYIESSATALFTAAYLKAIRLGYLAENDYKTVAVNGYKCLVNNFFSVDENGKVNIFGSCRSAGLGGSGNLYKAGAERFRDGSKEYYLLGYDVAKVEKTENKTEGKVLGAFIMAATEYERANQKAIRFSYDLAPTYTLAQGGSIKAEALGSGTISYQWFKSGDPDVSVATTATFSPTESGSYYCKATNGSTTIQTSTTAVTVEAASNENGGSNGEKVLFSTDFTEEAWTGVTTTSQTTSTTAMINGTQVTLKGFANETGFSVSNGTMTFPGNNMSDKNYYIAIPVSGVNGSITIEFGGTDNYKYYYDICSSTETPNRTETNKVSNGIVSVTESYSGTDAIIYIGRQGSSYTTISSIRITTPSSSTSTGYTITYDLNGHGDAIAEVTNATALPNPLPAPKTADGYTFVGWYTDSELNTAATAGATLTSDVTLYAKWTPITDLFTLTGVTSTTVSVGSKKTVEVKSDYATITGGSADLYNGHSSAKDMILSKQINLNGSSSSYLKITLDNSLKVGDEIIINPAASSFKLSAKDSNKDAVSFTGSYVIQEKDAVVGKNVIYLYKGSNSLITDINITRYYPESDSRATFTYNNAEIAFSEETAGDKSVYTTTLEIGASKAGKPITITPKTQNGATIKQDETIVNGNITITAPSTIGQTTTSTYTVTSKDGTSTTKYEINVKLVKENVVLVYAQSDGKTEWTWDKTANSTKPTFTNPTLKVYLANADGTKSDQEVTNVTGIKYKSDVTDVATVNETTGAITIQENANGGAKIYAILKDNGYYNDAQTFFNILVKQGYSYSVADDETIKNGPSLNQSVYIKNGDTKLVKMTFGGWKWSTFEDIDDHNKLKSTYEVNNSTRKDGWNMPTTSDESDIASIDGYKTYISGYSDAVDESKKKSDVAIYGSTRYGWFKPAKKRSSDNYLETYPYSLPVRGAYMTFEPTQNGTLTVYILQNGAWNTNRSGEYQGINFNDGEIVAGEFRPHSFYICNQRGLNVDQFSPNTFTCTTKQKVQGKYYCDRTTSDKQNDPYNIATWTEFKGYMSQGEQERVAANWSSGINDAQKIVKLDNGSYLAIQKGIVKYSFFVTANETYYLFSNFSKLGFCGANFVPSETVKPADDDAHKITLSDVSAYPKTERVTGDEDADKNKYAWKFGTDIKGYVKGFTIPLFNSITLTRTFKKDQWTTLSLPFNLTQTEVEQIFGKGTQIIVFDKAEPTSARIYLTFFYHEIQNVLPGYPYLIRPTLVDADGKQMVTKSNSADYAPTYTITNGNLTAFTVYNKAINPAIKPHEFKSGDYTAKCTPSYCTADISGNNNSNYSMQYEKGDIFVSEGNGTVYISEGSSYGKGYRSYIEYTGTTPPSAKALSISFSGVEDGDDNGTTTEIRVTELADDVIETLGIGGVYNLNGQKVADTTRNLPAGIYIVNGRKVVVK